MQNNSNPQSTGNDSKHQESKAKYPDLNLSAGEFVLLDVRRHWIGMAMSVLIGMIMAVVIIAMLILYPEIAPTDFPSVTVFLLPALLLLVLVAIGCYVPVWVYYANRFYVTNESVIENIQISLFAHRTQTIGLGSIEDVSFSQNGILQYMLGYGTIRMSTVGDEDTYTFNYVAQPKKYIDTIVNAVEEFKNSHAKR